MQNKKQFQTESLWLPVFNFSYITGTLKGYGLDSKIQTITSFLLLGLIKDGGWAVIDFRGFDLSYYGYTIFEANGNKIYERELPSIYKIY